MVDPPGTSQSLLDPQTLRELFRQLEATDVDELEVVAGSSRLYLRREPGKRTSVQSVPAPGTTPAGVPVVAPLTGVYYARPTPDQPPFVTPGAPIEAGQVVALIETMKLFNEVVAEIAGEVIDVAVHEGDLVEVGQPIMYLRPHTGE